MFSCPSVPRDAEMNICTFLSSVDAIITLVTVSESWYDAIHQPDAWMGTKVDLTTVCMDVRAWDQWWPTWRSAISISLGPSGAWLEVHERRGFKIVASPLNHWQLSFPHLWRRLSARRSQQQLYWVTTPHVRKFPLSHILLWQLGWKINNPNRYRFAFMLSETPTDIGNHSRPHLTSLNVIVNATSVQMPCRLCMGWVKNFDSEDWMHLAEYGYFKNMPYYVTNTSEDLLNFTVDQRDVLTYSEDFCDQASFSTRIQGCILSMRFFMKERGGLEWKSYLLDSRGPRVILTRKGHCKRRRVPGRFCFRDWTGSHMLSEAHFFAMMILPSYPDGDELPTVTLQPDVQYERIVDEAVEAPQ